MYRFSLLPSLLLIAATPHTASAQQPPSPTPAAAAMAPTALALQQDFVQIAKKVFPSVVTIRTFVRKADANDAAVTPASGPNAGAEPKSDNPAGWMMQPTVEPDYPDFRLHGQGSGFFVSADGDVLTGLGPLLQADGTMVDIVELETVDRHRILAEVTGIEPTLHLAVLRCAVFPSWARPAMQPVTFGDSDAMDVGSLVLGFGDPVGPERFLGTGLLVAKPSRDCYQELMSATYMQATMFVHPGAYGGPLVDVAGDVVGILCHFDAESGTPMQAAPGSAWALPSKIVSGLYESIREAGTTQSPWLGFSVMSRAEIATTRGMPAYQAMNKPPSGILIENVFTPSPSAASGIRPDDFLTHFNDVEIHAPVDFQRQLYLAGVGRKVRLTLFRAGETMQKELLIQARPDAAKPR